jgi:hypothetical protein
MNAGTIKKIKSTTEENLEQNPVNFTKTVLLGIGIPRFRDRYTQEYFTDAWKLQQP